MVPAPAVAEPWAVIGREESPSSQEYWRHHRDGVNSLHPSCGDVTPTPPEWTTEERTVTYREERGAATNTRHRDRAQGARRDRDRRRGDRRRGNRQVEERNQERERGALRRQRDRGERAYRARGPKGPRN